MGVGAVPPTPIPHPYEKCNKSVGVIKFVTPSAVPSFDFAQGGIALGVAAFSMPTYLEAYS
jgi:hypothetical protein